MSEHVPASAGTAMCSSAAAATDAVDPDAAGGPHAGRSVVRFTEAELNVLRLISEGRTIAAAAKILNIKHKTASLHLANAYGRAFGAYMGSGSATVRTQVLTLLDYAFTVRALVPPPAGRLALGELPRLILPLVVAGVPTGEQADRLGRTPADVAAATKRLREEAGLGPHEYWNRAVGWGHANGLLAPNTSSAITPEPADTTPATGVTSQPLCARALRA